MTFRKTLVILGLVGAVAAAAVVGTAFAQTPTPTPSGTNYQQLFLQKLASTLGISTSQLTSDITTARNQTVDQAVADGKLTQQQANNIKSKPANGLGPGFGFGHGPRGGFGFFGGPDVMNAVAQALGITTQDLQSQLQSGKTLAQIAQGKEQAVKDAITNTIKPKLDQAVKDGKLTSARETQILNDIQNSNLQFGGHWGMHHGPRDGKGPAGSRPSGGPMRSESGGL